MSQNKERERQRATVAKIGAATALAVAKLTSPDYNSVYAQSPTPYTVPTAPPPTALASPMPTVAHPTATEVPTARPTRTPIPSETPRLPDTLTPVPPTSTAARVDTPTTEPTPTRRPRFPRPTQPPIIIIRETQVVRETVVVAGTPVIVSGHTITFCERDAFGNFFQVVRDRATGQVLVPPLPIRPEACTVVRFVQKPRAPQYPAPVLPTQPRVEYPQVPFVPSYPYRPPPTPERPLVSPPARPAAPQAAPVTARAEARAEARIEDSRPVLAEPIPTAKPEELRKLLDVGEPVAPVNPVILGWLATIGALALAAVRRFRP